MAKKTDQERLQEIEVQMEKMKARKQQVESRMKEKARKERTKRLIETGAMFEKYFDIKSEEEAEQIAYGMREVVVKNKDKLKNIDVGKSKNQGKIVYKNEEEEIIVSG